MACFIGLDPELDISFLNSKSKLDWEEAMRLVLEQLSISPALRYLQLGNVNKFLNTYGVLDFLKLGLNLLPLEERVVADE